MNKKETQANQINSESKIKSQENSTQIQYKLQSSMNHMINNYQNRSKQFQNLQNDLYDIENVNFYHKKSNYIDEIPSDPFKLHNRIQSSFYQEDQFVRKQLKHQRSSSYGKDDVILRNSYSEDKTYFQNDLCNYKDKNNFDDNSIQSDHDDTRYMLNFLSLKNLNGLQESGQYMTPSERDLKKRLFIEQLQDLNNDDKQSDIQINPIDIQNNNQSQCCGLENDYSKDNFSDTTMSYSTDFDKNRLLSKSMFQENIDPNLTDELQYQIQSQNFSQMYIEEMNDYMEIHISQNDEDIFDKLSQIHPIKSDPLILKRQYSHKVSNNFNKFQSSDTKQANIQFELQSQSDHSFEEEKSQLSIHRKSKTIQKQKPKNTVNQQVKKGVSQSKNLQKKDNLIKKYKIYKDRIEKIKVKLDEQEQIEEQEQNKNLLNAQNLRQLQQSYHEQNEFEQDQMSYQNKKIKKSIDLSSSLSQDSRETLLDIHNIQQMQYIRPKISLKNQKDKYYQNFDYFYKRSCFRTMIQFYKEKFHGFYNKRMIDFKKKNFTGWQKLIKDGGIASLGKDEMTNILIDFFNEVFGKGIFEEACKNEEQERIILQNSIIVLFPHRESKSDKYMDEIKKDGLQRDEQDQILDFSIVRDVQYKYSKKAQDRFFTFPLQAFMFTAFALSDDGNRFIRDKPDNIKDPEKLRRILIDLSELKDQAVNSLRCSKQNIVNLQQQDSKNLDHDEQIKRFLFSHLQKMTNDKI